MILYYDSLCCSLRNKKTDTQTAEYDSFKTVCDIRFPPYLQHVDNNHGVGDVAVKFLLLSHIGQVDESPSYNSWSAIEEKLEVKPLANAWIELNAHHKVIEDVSCELAMGEKQVNIMRINLHFISICCV